MGSSALDQLDEDVVSNRQVVDRHGFRCLMGLCHLTGAVVDGGDAASAESGHIGPPLLGPHLASNEGGKTL